MEDVVRFDGGTISGKAVRTDDGFLRVDAIVTRTGVLTYRNADGTTRRELRHPDDVLALDSLETLKMRPVTNDHPWKEPRRLVTADNAKRLQVGYTGENIRPEGKYLRAPLIITDADTIKAIENGRRELSCGYLSQTVEESGTFDGESYTHRQKAIRYNHVALVDRARVGSEARIHLDAEDAVQVDGDDAPKGEVHMDKLATVNLDGIDYQAAPEVAKALSKAQSAVADAQAKLDAANAEHEKTKADRDATKAKLDALEKVDRRAEVDAAVKARLELVSKARPIIGEKVKLDGGEVSLDEMTDEQIRRAVISKQLPTIKLDGQSDVYVSAMFDAACVAPVTTKSDGLANQRATVTRPQTGGDVRTDSASARQRMIDRMKNKTQAA